MNSLLALLLLLPPIARSQSWVDYSTLQQFWIGPQSNAVPSYNEAKIACERMTAHVANVKTKRIFDFLVKHIGHLSDFPYSYYIGARRVNTSDGIKLLWTDGSDASHGQWWSNGGSAEPDNKGGFENCVVMGLISSLDSTFKWRDVPCSSYSRYICERLPPTTTTTASTTTTPTTRSTTPPKTSAPSVTTTTLSTRTTQTTTASTTITQTATYTSPISPVTTASPAERRNDNLPIIIGSVVAAIVIISIICIAVFCVISKRRKEKRSNRTNNVNLAGVENPTATTIDFEPEDTYAEAVATQHTDANVLERDYDTTQKPGYHAYDVTYDLEKSMTYNALQSADSEQDTYNQLQLFHPGAKTQGTGPEDNNIDSDAYDVLSHAQKPPSPRKTAKPPGQIYAEVKKTKRKS